MKNKKGFTLIELLAVIVILAIIALIAVPIVLNIINNAKESSDERSAELYIDAVEKAVARKNLNEEFSPSSCEIQTNGNIICDSQTEEIKIEVKGSKPTSGTIVFKKLKIKEATMNLNNKEIIFENGKIISKQPSVTYKNYENGEEVYFDVSTGKGCSDKEYHEDNSKTGYNGITKSTTNQNGCLKFYAFNYDGGEKLNLILDHNTTAKIAWNSSGSNNTGPDDTFLTQLKTDTGEWEGTLTPENYTMDQSKQSSKAKYTIDYGEYKARIITAQEVAQITGNDLFDEVTSSADNWFSFDTNTTTDSDTCKSGNTTGCKYGWLYDRTHTACETHGCNNNSDQETSGYWTFSSVASTSLRAWRMYFNHINSVGVNVSQYGIRPVITVLKSNL